MSGTFADRIDELADRVGHGDLQASCVVDQVYARYQHEGLDLKHPEGGQAKYLEEPVHAAEGEYMSRLAKSVLDGRLVEAAEQVAEDMSEAVYVHAPFEFGDLRASGHPSVRDDGRVAYDRPPRVHRLTEDELRAKGDLRDLGFGNI